jgi:hypothetical protein
VPDVQTFHGVARTTVSVLRLTFQDTRLSDKLDLQEIRISDLELGFQDATVS